MTLRELKELVNSLDESVLDKEIKYCNESNGVGWWCYDAWFDIQFLGKNVYPVITTCNTKESWEGHDGRTPWTKLSGWMGYDD